MNLKGSKCGYVHMVVKEKKKRFKEARNNKIICESVGFSKRTLLHGYVSLCEECSSGELKDTTRKIISFTIKRNRFSSEASPFCFM